ncbi:hypothetical protein [Nostoc sp. 'Peltigera membranacea cyanobiont' N6]|uniref:hypothetical protein n=1 Tax=Nostoc sp. 'Peltigera membranacea cyanobiont' N6 TaxID=1261031 RepID=UPI000D0C6751|nr:hypothetical protein [Nostoc sp. 'Peltigera membranacea cyanobiont' N6]AVH68125.1 hypothetical protein NPM_10035 [Nostoc sp. 'Peltigera membranacea cyanobiont' N6]
MDKIQQLLQPHNIEVSLEEIAKLCVEVGADIEQLSDSDAQTIAQHILEQRQATGKLTTANGKSKNSNGKLGKNSPRRKSTPPLQGAIAHASQVSNQEIQSLEDVLNVGIDAYTTDKADQLLSTIRNAPKDVVSKFVSKAMEEEADVDSFRAIGDELVAGIFGISPTNAAE